MYMQSIFHAFRVSFWMGILCFFAFVSCGELDTALVNDVKRLEPEWMTLSEQVSFIDRNLKISERRYQSDLEIIDQRVSLKHISDQVVKDLQSDFREIMVRRDELQQGFDELKKDFTKEVYAFNDWQNLVLKNDVDMEEAEAQLAEFRAIHSTLAVQIHELRDQLLANLTAHNTTLRELSNELNIYTNFDIVPK